MDDKAPPPGKIYEELSVILSIVREQAFLFLTQYPPLFPFDRIPNIFDHGVKDSEISIQERFYIRIMSERECF